MTPNPNNVINKLGVFKGYSTFFIGREDNYYVDWRKIKHLVNRTISKACRRHKKNWWGYNLCSGSNLCYAPALADIKSAINEREDITSVYISFPLINNPEYGGLHFYSHHVLTEYLSVFNQEIKSAFAIASGENFAVIADNGYFPVFFNCSVGAGSLQYGVYFKNGTNIFKEVNWKNGHKDQLEDFLLTAKNKIIPHNYENQLLPVKLSCAIDKSLKTGLKVDIVKKQ